MAAASPERFARPQEMLQRFLRFAAREVEASRAELGHGVLRIHLGRFPVELECAIVLVAGLEELGAEDVRGRVVRLQVFGRG